MSFLGKSIAKKKTPDLSQGLLSFVKPNYDPPTPNLSVVKPNNPKKTLPRQDMLLPGLTDVQNNLGSQRHTHAWVAYQRGEISKKQYQDVITGVEAHRASRLFDKIRRRLAFGRDKTAEVKNKKKSKELTKLLQAKKYSDEGNYKAKYDILETMMAKHPEKFRVDSRLNSKFVGVTHLPTSFKIHVPGMLVPINVEKQAMILRSAFAPSDR
jgi:hypothetical protein